jgi:hypothetical protein
MTEQPMNQCTGHLLSRVRSPPAEIKNSKLYTGSCHCGAVTLALKTKGPLSKEGEVIGECDCSICARVRQPEFP